MVFVGKNLAPAFAIEFSSNFTKILSDIDQKYQSLLNKLESEFKKEKTEREKLEKRNKE